VTRAGLPDGYEVTLHRSLTEPMMMAGAPRTVAISIGTLAAAVGIGLQLWVAGAGIWLVGHALAVWAARIEPQFPQVFARHLKQRGFLDV
jgi:type IV secretory pathway TrbD component